MGTERHLTGIAGSRQSVLEHHTISSFLSLNVFTLLPDWPVYIEKFLAWFFYFYYATIDS
jgi:hypothetical protein